MKIDKILADLGYSHGSDNFDGLNDIFIKKYNEYHAQKDEDDNKNKEFDDELIELFEQLHDIEEYSEELAIEKTKNLLLEKKMKKKAKQEEKKAKEQAEKQAEAEKQVKEKEDAKIKAEQEKEKQNETQVKYYSEKDLKNKGIPMSKYMILGLFPKSFQYKDDKYIPVNSPFFAKWRKE